MKIRRKDGGTPQFSFIDILFSTIGTIIFIIAVNMLFIASYQGLKSDSNVMIDHIEKTSSIFTPRRIQYDIYGSPLWLNPVFLLLGADKSSAVYKETVKFDDINDIKNFIREIYELNCIYKRQGRKKRYSIIIGITSDTYKLADELSQYIYMSETELKKQYGDDFYPLNISKIPAIEDELPRIDNIWEETEIEIIR